MGDLQEIRRYWPSATGKYGYYSARVRGVSMSVWATDDYGSPHLEVCVIDGRTDVARVRTNRWHRIHRDNNPIGPTIAAAMAAAGFAERKKGFFAEYNQVDTAVWLRVTKRHADKYAGKTRIPLKSRQRSRKGVRLGERGRRLALAASIGEALDATKHWRGKRKHKEVP